MKRIVLLAVLTVALGLSAFAQQRFVAHLTGAQAIPGNFSIAKAHCKIVLNSEQTQITVSCKYSDITPNGIYIHGNGAVGERAPVLFDLGRVSGRSGMTGPTTFDLTSAQVASMRAHLMYVSIPSPWVRAGEIRGQIKQVHTVADNEGDGRSDPTVFRPSTSEFWSVHSLRGTVGRVIFGSGSEDTFFNDTGDFDGDGRFDPLLITVINDKIVWKIWQSDTKSLKTLTLGNSTDSMAIADYDGDGMLDTAVYRRSAGQFLIVESSTGASRTEPWGKPNDYPAVGDYDGDGRADLATVRTEGSDLVWYIRNSSTGKLRREVFGNSATDGFQFFSPFDWDGDGRQDLRVNNGSSPREHRILRSTDGRVDTLRWGIENDAHFYGDYDGDGKTDLVARRRVQGHYFWHVWQTSNSQTTYSTWGIAPLEFEGADRPEGNSPGFQAGRPSGL